MLSSSTVNSTGLICTLAFDRAVTAASGNPYATPLAYTSGGSLINLNYVSGSGTNSWQYAIANGNPSGSPVLDDAVVLANIGSGVFVGGGVANAAVVNGSVTNGSAVQYPSQISGLIAFPVVSLCRSGSKLWQDAAKTTLATAHGAPVRVMQCTFTGFEVTAPSDATRPTLQTDGTYWWLLGNGTNSEMYSPAVLTVNQPLTLACRNTWEAGTGGNQITVAARDSVFGFIDNSRNQKLYANGTAFAAGLATYGSVYSMQYFVSGASSVIRTNGSETTGNPGSGVGNRFMVLSINAAGFANSKWACGGLVSQGLTTAEKSQLDTYMGAFL